LVGQEDFDGPNNVQDNSNESTNTSEAKNNTDDSRDDHDVVSGLVSVPDGTNTEPDEDVQDTSENSGHFVSCRRNVKHFLSLILSEKQANENCLFRPIAKFQR
jgi:hypothetical protein